MTPDILTHLNQIDTTLDQWEADIDQLAKTLEPSEFQDFVFKQVTAAVEEAETTYSFTKFAKLQSATTKLLEAAPDVAARLPSYCHKFLFSLTLDFPQNSWEKKSGVCLVNLISEGVKRLGIREHMVKGQTLDDTPIVKWLNSDSERSLAWERHLEKDEERINQEMSWRQVWLPDGNWEGSPLQSWCTSVNHGNIEEARKLAPIDHPLLQTHGKKRKTATLLRRLARSYINAFNKIETSESSLFIHNNNHLEWIAPTTKLEILAPNLLLLGMLENSDWFSQLCKKDPTQMLRQLYDPRVLVYLASNDSKHVLTWLINHKSWRTWKNEEGLSFMEALITKSPNHKINLFPEDNKIEILARRFPEILTAHTRYGMVFECLEMREEVRARVKSLLLLKSSRLSLTDEFAEKKKSHQKPRM